MYAVETHPEYTALTNRLTTLTLVESGLWRAGIGLAADAHTLSIVERLLERRLSCTVPWRAAEAIGDRLGFVGADPLLLWRRRWCVYILRFTHLRSAR